ncbi:MAG: hypothetical protein J0L97_01075 [Alphaproteobacteria bacterium]|nr:hypothetical protein [Alphaproteobacteria bacterium]
MRIAWAVAIVMVFTPALSRANEAAYAQAFATLQKTYTPYDMDAATAKTAEEKRFLSLLFLEVARAATLRVKLQEAMEQGRNVTDWESAYAQILHAMRSLQPPENLRAVQTLIVKVVEKHEQIFLTWRSEGWKKLDVEDTRVGETHHQLLAAYTMLIGIYPQDKNQRVFYDHLCTLDFI